MTSLGTRRLIAGVGGVLYALVYGFWTVIATGGGHVNFIWLWLFLTVCFFGLYFPLMAVMAVDLRSRLIKLIFGSLIVFYLLASMVMILGWVNEQATDRPSDFARAIRANGTEGILLCTALHFLPTIIFTFFLIKSILRADPRPEEDRFVNLKIT